MTPKEQFNLIKEEMEQRSDIFSDGFSYYGDEDTRDKFYRQLVKKLNRKE